MAAPQYDLTALRGNTWQQDFRITVAAAGVTSPSDLTGLAFTLEMRVGTERVVKSCTVAQPPSGVVSCALSVAEVATLPVGKVRYELVGAGSGVVTTYLQGHLDVQEWVGD